MFYRVLWSLLTLAVVNGSIALSYIAYTVHRDPPQLVMPESAEPPTLILVPVNAQTVSQ